MTFNLVRWGFPNTAAVLALAVIPFVATLADWQPKQTVKARIEGCGNLPDSYGVHNDSNHGWQDIFFE